MDNILRLEEAKKAEEAKVYDEFEKLLKGEDKAKIALEAPVIDIREWYRSGANYLGTYLGLTDEELERIIYFSDYVVTEGNDKGKIIGAGEYEKDKGKYPAVSGAEGIEFLFGLAEPGRMMSEARGNEREAMAALERLYARSVSEEEVADHLENLERMHGKLDAARAKIDATLYFGITKRPPSLKTIRVIPLEVRTKVLEFCRFAPYAADDIAFLYKRVAARNERLRKLISLNAPEILIRNEKRVLQEHVDELFANGKRGKPVTRSGRALISLSDILAKTVSFAG